MSDEPHTIPDHVAARVARLINEAEDMRQQGADSLKQIYSDLRDDLREMGWKGSTISTEVAAFKGAVSEMRLDDATKDKREEKGERIDDYVSMLSRARARESSQSVGNPDELSTTPKARNSKASSAETGDLGTTHFDPETGEIHDADSGQHVGQQDGEQRGSTPVSSSVGRGEIADDGDQGQGAGASGTDRGVGSVEGELDCQDEDRGSRHVGGEVDHEVAETGELTDTQEQPDEPASQSEIESGAPTAVDDRPTSPAAREADESAAPHSPSDAASSVAVAETQAPQAATATLSDDDVPAFIKRDYVLRPHCLNPSLCAGSGSKHCHACLKARDGAILADEVSA